MTDTLTLCAQLAAWHRDRGDEWAAGHIDRMNHAERIRLARSIRANEPELVVHRITGSASSAPQPNRGTLSFANRTTRKVA